MTIGENVGKVINWITESLTGTCPDYPCDTDDGYESGDEAFKFGDGRYTSYDGNAVRKPAYYKNEDTNVLKHPGYKGHEVRIIESRSFGDTTQIVKMLLEQKTVVLNLHLLDKEQSQRTIDFVCGAAFALGGSPQKVGDTVFVFTPNSVQLSVEAKETNAFGTESLWGRTL